MVDTHGFPVLRDAVKARLSLSTEEEQRLLEKWSAHSCLAWLANRELLRDVPEGDDMQELKQYALLGVPDEFRPDVTHLPTQFDSLCRCIEQQFLEYAVLSDSWRVVP